MRDVDRLVQGRAAAEEKQDLRTMIPGLLPLVDHLFFFNHIKT
jgi:hypothetical protein